MVYDQQLCKQVQQLQEDKRLTQQNQLETEETLQHMMRQSEHLQPQLTHEQEAANRGTREMEKENHQQVSPILSHITCMYTHTHTHMSLQYLLLYCAQYMHNSSVCYEFDDINDFVLYRRR